MADNVGRGDWCLSLAMVLAAGLFLVVTALLAPRVPPAARLASGTASTEAASAALATQPAVAGTTRRRLLVQGAAVASAAIAGRAHAAEKLLWISGKSDPIRPTSKDKPDGTKKDPKCGGTPSRT